MSVLAVTHHDYQRNPTNAVPHLAHTITSGTAQKSMICKQCGGEIPNDETCNDRFNILLALDHSRQAPWGPRHGPAFAVFALQHADDYMDETLGAALAMLNRIYVAGDDPADVVQELRKSHGKPADWSGASPPPRERAPRRFAVTIADLGDFEADTYAEKLDAMCLATIEAWDSVM